MVWTLAKASSKQIIISHEHGGSSFIIVQNNNDSLGPEVIYDSAASGKNFASSVELESCLSEMTGRHNAQKATCSVVMRYGTYSHLLVDKPVVPAKEMADALEWLTKDKVKALPYETPLLSHFYGSELWAGKEKNKLHVVVAERSVVASYQQLILRQGLALGAMTIEELATVKMLRKDSEDCVVVYLALCPERSNSAIFALNDKLLSVKRLPAVTLDARKREEEFSQLWQGLQKDLEHCLHGLKKDYPYKVMLSPCSYEHYSDCKELLQHSFANKFDADIELFDFKNNFYAGPMADELCEKNNLLLLGAC